LLRNRILYAKEFRGAFSSNDPFVARGLSGA
jgi:hypothetical protein